MSEQSENTDKQTSIVTLWCQKCQRKSSCVKDHATSVVACWNCKRIVKESA